MKNSHNKTNKCTNVKSMYFFFSRTLPLQYRVGYQKHKLDILLIWCTQIMIALPAYNNQSNISNCVYYYYRCIIIIICNCNYIYLLLFYFNPLNDKLNPICQRYSELAIFSTLAGKWLIPKPLLTTYKTTPLASYEPVLRCC